MAADCIKNLETAIQAVKDEYGSDAKYSGVIDYADKALSEARSAEGHSQVSPGQKAASQVHAESQAEEKAETPEEQSKENESDEKHEVESPKEDSAPGEEKDPKDMKGAAKIALLMLRKK